MSGDTLGRLLGADWTGAVLAIGAHADDIEIGCGTTLRRLVAERPELELRWVVLSATAERADEARSSAAVLADGARLEVAVHGFRESYFPWSGSELKEQIAALASPAPALVLAPRLEDAHQDHRTVAEIVWQTFRGSLILEYEIPKYEGDLGTPNLFVACDAAEASWKADHLLASFPSQHRRTWFTRDTFVALMRVRGVECAAPGGYAEAFTARKLRL